MATQRSTRVTTIDLSGPFFRASPSKTFRQNVRTMMAAVAEEAEADVKAQMSAGETGRKPMRGIRGSERVSGHVIGRVKSLTGKQWAVTAVVSVNNSGFSARQGITLMAAASQVEQQTHAFRRTASRLRSARAINRAELLKDLQ